MKKALVITSVASMVDQFLLPSIGLLQELGCEVHVACNFEKGSTCSDRRIAVLKKELEERQVSYFQIDFARNVLKVTENIRAYLQVKQLLSENRYDLVHCHSPVGGLLTRLAGRKSRKQGTKILYTAHGFHFYKGAPLKNWLFYYPVEKICAAFTDVLITINREDYAFARKKMKAARVEYIPGVGIDLEKFGNIAVDRTAKRRAVGVPENGMLLFSVGELNLNKNHEVVIRAIAGMDVYYAIAGKGNLQERLQHAIDELGMTDRVRLLGFREDIAELYKAADVFVFPSLREGLSVAMTEAMASGLPVACSAIRGNVDLVDGNGGALFDPRKVESCTAAIKQVLAMPDAGAYNGDKAKRFGVDSVNRRLSEIYYAYLQ